MKDKNIFKIVIALASTGLLFLLAGIIIPLIIEYQKKRSLQSIWLEPQNSDSWSVIPGKQDVQLMRDIRYINYTNTQQIFRGGKPEAVEMPGYRLQQFSTYIDWFYTDKNGTDFGQDIGSDLIAYHSKKQIKYKGWSDQELTNNTKVTVFNSVPYGFIYSLGNNLPPLYSISNLHDVVQAFQSDLYQMAIAFAIWKSQFNETNTAQTYLLNNGFSQFEIESLINNALYGWNSWETLRPWVTAVLERIEGKIYDGALEAIKNEFQFQRIEILVDQTSLLRNVTEAIVNYDMISRYGTNNRTELAYLQWAEAAVTNNLPLNTGRFYSFVQMNQTFNFLPEMSYYLLVSTQDFINFTDVAPDLLQIPKQLPYNDKSMMNFNNIAAFFTLYLQQDFITIESIFNLTAEQTIALGGYLIQLAYLPVDWQGTSIDFDGYSQMFARWTQNSLVRESNQLKKDLRWGLAAGNILCEWAKQGISCTKFFLSNGIDQQIAELVCSGSTGWNPIDWDWTNFVVWVQASMKDQTSISFQKLENYSGLNQTEIQTVLYTGPQNLNQIVNSTLISLSQHYECSNLHCTQNQMYVNQWATGRYTSLVPQSMVSCANSTRTMKDWNPKKYTVAVEWAQYSDLYLSKQLVESYLSYRNFSNPARIRLYYNRFFEGDILTVAAYYQFPSPSYVQAFYDYFQSIIPGFTFFQTVTIEQATYGYIDTFLYYIGCQLNMLNGGYPLICLYANNKVVYDTNDQSDFPLLIIYSGLNEPTKTTAYYKYYGETYISNWGISYDTSSPTGFKYKSTNIWDTKIPIQGSEGGSFGIYVSKDDRPPVFVSSFLVVLKMKYTQKDTYKGIDCLKFEIAQEDLKTSEYVPANIKYNQYPNGFNGILNITAYAGYPTFISQRRCYKCQTDALRMINLYAYDPVNYKSKLIYPDESCNSYAIVQPLSGAGVGVNLNVQQMNTVYRDRFTPNIYQAVPGKGMYLPFYELKRSFNWTQSRMDDSFGGLKAFEDTRKYTFYFGLTFGSFFIILSMLGIAFIYRKRKFGGWKSRKVSSVFVRRLSSVEDDVKEFKD